jgi:hypothetical protein
MQRALNQKVLGEKPHRELLAFLLFCFGLLREFDLPNLVELCAPVPIHDSNRGPLRAAESR